VRDQAGCTPKAPQSLQAAAGINLEWSCELALPPGPPRLLANPAVTLHTPAPCLCTLTSSGMR
jgi:hypothetical protein